MTRQLKTLVSTLVATTALVVPAFASANNLAAVCKADLKKMGCPTAKTDEEVNACLDKNEKANQPNEGLSKACYQAHESYEKKTGTMEQGQQAMPKDNPGSTQPNNSQY